MKTSISLTLDWRKLLTTNAIEKSLLNKIKNKLEEGQRLMLECQKDILLAGKSQCGWYMVEEYPHPCGLHLHMHLLPLFWPACSKTSSHPPPYAPEVCSLSTKYVFLLVKPGIDTLLVQLLPNNSLLSSQDDYKSMNHM